MARARDYNRRTRAQQVIDEKGPGREQWSTTGDIARTFGVKVATVKTWVKRGQWPAPEARSSAQGWALWSPETVARETQRRLH